MTDAIKNFKIDCKKYKKTEFSSKKIVDREQQKYAPSALIGLLAGALTDDIANWFKDWSGGDELGLDSKTDIYAVVSKRLGNGTEI